VGTVSNGSVINSWVLDPNSSANPGWDFNPGVGALFPWLSSIANSYERFRFEGLAFDLVSSQPTLAAGRVYMAVDYDWDDEIPATKGEFMGNMTAVEGPVWSSLKIKCDPSALMRDMPYKYINTAGRVVYSEPRTAYSGFLMIGFDTSTANCRFDLWVDYNVVFEVPVTEQLGASLSKPVVDAPNAPYVTYKSPWDGGSVVNSQKWVLAQWAANQVKGKVREVIGGLGDVPVFAPPSGSNAGVANLPGWGRAIDIGRLGLARYLSFDGALSTTNASPSSWITGGQPQLSALIYDGVGSFLGQVFASTTGIKCTDIGFNVIPSEWSTTGKFAFPHFSFNVGGLKDLYSQARYVMPLLGVLSSFSTAVDGYSGIDYRVW